MLAGRILHLWPADGETPASPSPTPLPYREMLRDTGKEG